MTKSIFVVFILLSTFSITASSSADRAYKQKALDKRCEIARTEKIIPLRQNLINECSKTKDLKTCKAEYENYGERVGVKVPLFYDLPECEKAAEHLRSYRQGSK